MQIQYLVGLCCLKQNPDAVDITIGDLVMDHSAEKKRDVDITVTLDEGGGKKIAFKAYEVKKESKPLDVIAVEQLCIKLNDMIDITYKAIVSASGFTESAIKKADSHNVNLYELKPWTTPLSEHFEIFGNAGHLKDVMHDKGNMLLYWIKYSIFIGVLKETKDFNWLNTDTVYSGNGKINKTYPSMEQFTNHILLKSTRLLFNIEPAKSMFNSNLSNLFEGKIESTPAWSHSHTLELKEEKAFVEVGQDLAQIHEATITGELQWRKKIAVPEYVILENVITKEVFAGAAITPCGSPDGQLRATILTPNSNSIKFHFINLSEKQKNFIQKLKLT